MSPKRTWIDFNDGKKSPLKNVLVGTVGVVSLIYLLNFTAGVPFEIPDIFPLVGNLDELTASLFLISALKYFGVDITAWKNSSEDGGGSTKPTNNKDT